MDYIQEGGDLVEESQLTDEIGKDFSYDKKI